MSNKAQAESTEAQEPSTVESTKAVMACQDYLRMGVGRSLQKLSERYHNVAEVPPTKRLNTLKKWSGLFNWQERANEYDNAIDAEKEQRRREVMGDGLALEYARVEELSEIYAKLKDEFVEGGLWFTDIKLSAKGDTVEVDVFNKPLIDSLRGVLDDLAKETGGRKQKVEHGGSNGGPIGVHAEHSGRVEVENSVSETTISGVLGILRGVHAFAAGTELEDDQDATGEVVSR